MVAVARDVPRREPDLEQTVVAALAAVGFRLGDNYERLVVASAPNMQCPYVCGADMQVRVEGLKVPGGADAQAAFFWGQSPVYDRLKAALSSVLRESDGWNHDATMGDGMTWSRLPEGVNPWL